MRSSMLAVTALAAISSVYALPQQGGSSSTVAGAVPSPSSSSSPSSGGNSTSGQACNNSPSLCSRKYNQITHAGAHDSAFLRDASTGNSIAGNQFKNATKALDAGIRLLQAQVHDKDGVQHLCHTSCSLLDAGPLKDWLALIGDWVNSNPNEVVTMLLVNSDSASTATFDSIYKDAGVDKLGYKPPTTGATADWPTLQTMIDQKTRMVNFITDIDSSPSAPYLMPEFNYMFETAYEITELSGFNCTLDRPSSQADAAAALSANRLSLVNHFKYQTIASSFQVPDVDNITTVNSAGTSDTGNLGLHLQTCKSEWGQVPNFFLVDFFDQANPIVAADNMNDLKDITGRKTDSADDDKSMGSANGRNLMHGALVAFFAAAVLLL